MPVHAWLPDGGVCARHGSLWLNPAVLFLAASTATRGVTAALRPCLRRAAAALCSCLRRTTAALSPCLRGTRDALDRDAALLRSGVHLQAVLFADASTFLFGLGQTQTLSQRGALLIGHQLIGVEAVLIAQLIPVLCLEQVFVLGFQLVLVLGLQPVLRRRHADTTQRQGQDKGVDHRLLFHGGSFGRLTELQIKQHRNFLLHPVFARKSF